MALCIFSWRDVFLFRYTGRGVDMVGYKEESEKSEGAILGKLVDLFLCIWNGVNIGKFYV